MTSVSFGTKTITRYIWTVPCYGEQTSAVMGDVQDAMSFASRNLEELGRPVKSSDAFFVQPYDDAIRVWFDHEQDDERPETKNPIGDFVAWVIASATTEDEEVVLRLLKRYQAERGS